MSAEVSPEVSRHDAPAGAPETPHDGLSLCDALRALALDVLDVEHQEDGTTDRLLTLAAQADRLERERDEARGQVEQAWEEGYTTGYEDQRYRDTTKPQPANPYRAALADRQARS